ncbi:sterol 26-hydroxylase, mitochondrial isoform X1 [Gadus morhua]|nr:sterol 26-hydroxylase, mitochondrial isoform X1 [Gadus morhua]
MAACLVRSSVLRRASPGHWLRPRPSTGALVSCRAEGGPPSSSIALPASGGDKLRTIQDLPKVGLWEVVYRMVFQGYYNRLHDLQIHEKELYGPIYVGGFKTVSLSSVKLMEEVLRKEEKFPSRGDMSLWTDYRNMRGLGYGPFTEEGKNWYNLRALLNKRMLHPRDAVRYGPVINEVVTDLIKRICYLRQASPCGTLVTDVSNNLYLFSLEGISSVLFEKRIGCLENAIPDGTQHFIDSIAQMFANSAGVILLPKWAQRFSPHWHRYIAGWDGIFKFAGQLIDKKVEEMERRLGEQQEVEGEYLTYLLSNTQLSRKEVYGSVTELLLAGVDTTSNTLMWALHLLSKNPEAQETLYKEVSDHTDILSAEEVNSMPYLKAVIKETLRMYPVVVMNARRNIEKDVVIGGYHFPKNTVFGFSLYAMSHDEETFPEPWRFEPGRWLRDGRERPYPFGSIPFGFGVRGCVGRRIAELEMHLSLARMIKLFKVEPDPTLEEIKPVSRTVLVADRQVNLHFLDRSNQSQR